MMDKIDGIIRTLYWFCTDFTVNLANLLGITYTEINFILFLVIFPVFTLMLIFLVCWQGFHIHKLSRYSSNTSAVYSGSPLTSGGECGQQPSDVGDAAATSLHQKKSKRLLIVTAGLILLLILLFFPGCYFYRLVAPHHPDLVLMPFWQENLFVQNPMFWLTGRCYGQKPLVSALKVASADFAARHPGAGMAYFDISGAYGGSLLKHLSHKHGYDVDLLYIGRDGKGRLYPQRPSLARIGYRLRYNKNGVCQGRQFDCPANLALIVSLLEQTAAGVDMILVEPFIEELLIQEAKKQRMPSATVLRLQKVLRYAGDGAAPHTDHMHVRFNLEKLS